LTVRARSFLVATEQARGTVADKPSTCNCVIGSLCSQQLLREHTAYLSPSGA
jgi:hypothetical protein